MKVLISWQAAMNDFISIDRRKTSINENGTHCELYKNAFDYDKHVFLCSKSEESEDNYFSYLCNHLRTTYQKEVTPMFLGINNVISVEEILKKVRPILVNHANETVEIFISPGTPAMQTVWYLLGFEFPEIKLFQAVPPKHRNGNSYQRKYITINPSISSALAVREQVQKESTQQKDIFKSKKIQTIYDLATEIATPYPITTLILGKTGTGKEWIANHICKESSRDSDIFLAINCAGMNDELLASELFGHVKGAFTGATTERKGAFQKAHEGTLFLDEIGDISKKMQQTLLRVLQDGVIYKLGSYDPIKVDVRIIAATNKDLFEMTETGAFRADLYYRLAVAEIETLSFNELPAEEREEYFEFFIQKWKKKLRRKKIHFDKGVKRMLDLHPFPGNFRELENLIERFYTYSKQDGLVTMDMVPNRIKHPEGRSFSLKIKDVENAHYKKVYKMFKGNKSKMYEALDIDKKKWNRIIKELELI
jgi:transcriptional regulator with PAS, ATPase and Fis domain